MDPQATWSAALIIPAVVSTVIAIPARRRQTDSVRDWAAERCRIRVLSRLSVHVAVLGDAGAGLPVDRAVPDGGCAAGLNRPGSDGVSHCRKGESYGSTEEVQRRVA